MIELRTIPLLRTAAGLSVVAALGFLGLLVSGVQHWFWTGDQRGTFALRDGDPARAAELFEDPLWRGIAQYRAGDFEGAAVSFAAKSDAVSVFDRANALVLLGKYEDAVRIYDAALVLRPGWREAEENRELARRRGERIERKGGNMTEGKLGADGVVIQPPGGKRGGSDASSSGESAQLGEAETRALWMRRVRTSPAEFLKSKFAFQAQEAERVGAKSTETGDAAK